MPELLADGLPDRPSRSRFDFSEWTDGQAWKFVKGTDYESSTETFRANVKRWAKLHGYSVALRPYPATDGDGREIPLIKQDAIALGVRFIANGATDRNGAGESDATSTPAAASRHRAPSA